MKCIVAGQKYNCRAGHGTRGGVEREGERGRERVERRGSEEKGRDREGEKKKENDKEKDKGNVIKEKQ